MCILLGEFISV